MIWRWRIFFESAPLRSRFFVILALLALPLRAAMVSGEVRLVSDSPSKRLKDFSGVAVWLSAPGKTPGETPAKHARMLQQDKKFTPHLLVVEMGATVDFPNLDPIFHNAFSNFNGQIFDIGLYAPGSSRSVQFRRPGIVRVFCNIHPSMSAIIVVADSSYFAITRKDGSFTIPDVPPGAYEMHFFHERATPENLARLITPISVTTGTLKLQAVSISETGYLPVAHKNKYGRDYPANADGQAGYSGLIR